MNQEKIYALLEQYKAVLPVCAEENHLTEERLIENMFSVLCWKDAAAVNYRILIEEPEQYLANGELLSEQELRRAFMSLFGEDTAGALIRCHYDREAGDALVLSAAYEEAVPVWDILSLMGRAFPMIREEGDGLLLCFGKEPEEAIKKSSVFSETLLEREDLHEDVLYFESAYEETLFAEEPESEEDASFNSEEDLPF